MKRLVPIAFVILIITIIGNAAQAQNFFKVDVQGKGKPMILIHGLYCSSEVWEETIERYKNNYECHTLTLAGFAGNPANLNEQFLSSVTNDLIAYIKAKKLNKPVIMGHSMVDLFLSWQAQPHRGFSVK
jgi:pimeloyl-ACP methyl ester carboxylesterase